jgi:hypothetical protein
MKHILIAVGQVTLNFRIHIKGAPDLKLFRLRQHSGTCHMRYNCLVDPRSVLTCSVLHQRYSDYFRTQREHVCVYNTDAVGLLQGR